MLIIVTKVCMSTTFMLDLKKSFWRRQKGNLKLFKWKDRAGIISYMELFHRRQGRMKLSSVGKCPIKCTDLLSHIWMTWCHNGHIFSRYLQIWINRHGSFYVFMLRDLVSMSSEMSFRSDSETSVTHKSKTFKHQSLFYKLQNIIQH